MKPVSQASALTFLVASTPITAHTLNAGKLVTGLVEAGHTVLWYTADRFSAHVRQCGAEPLASSVTSSGFEALSGIRGTELQRVRRLYRDHVVGGASGQLSDLRRLVGGTRVDAVLSDTLMPAAGILASALALPWATFGDGPLLWWDEDTPPFGTGLPPMRGPAGRHRNRHVQAAIDRWLFDPLFEDLSHLRASLDAPPVTSWREAVMSHQLHLQGCGPGFEYPRRELPEQIHFVGALGPAQPIGEETPAHLTRRKRSRPLALVTQGTLRPDLRELVLPACRALVREGWDVLVAGVEDGAWNRWRGQVHPMRRVDYVSALAETDVFITNGGYTGVTLAIAAGVPVVQAGNSEEKPDIGARVAWAGVGASLRTKRPPAWLLRATIRRVLASPRRRAASRRLARESQDHDASVLGPALLTRLASGTLHG